MRVGILCIFMNIQWSSDISEPDVSGSCISRTHSLDISCLIQTNLVSRIPKLEIKQENHWKTSTLTSTATDFSGSCQIKFLYLH